MYQLELSLAYHGLRAVKRSTNDRDRSVVAESIVPNQLEKPGPSSVFDLANMSIKRVRLSEQKQRPHTKLVELPGGRRVRTVIHEMETDEWQERDYQRRARQVLPQPPMSVRTKSEKIKKMIGGK